MTTRIRAPFRIVIRVLVAAAAALLVAGLLILGPLAAYALLSPFSGIAVPRACVPGGSDPASRAVVVPGHGDGTVIAADGPTSVVVVPALDGRTAGGSVHVLRGRDAIFSLPIASRAVAAGIADGRVYVFDDKIGHFLDATTGAPLPRVFTVDNYRGLYTSDGVDFVQTTFEVGFVGLPGVPFMARGMPFAAVVDGCLLASVGLP